MYYLTPVKNSEDFDHFIEGLIKAGYEGNPSSYYKLEKENRLTGHEIRELIFGKKIESTWFTIPWSLTTSKDGKAELYNPFYGAHKGKSWIEGDTVCNQYKSRYDGLKYCSEIYKITEGNKIVSNKYLLLNDFMLAPFSIVE